ncbi:MAG: YjbH domain-containing protein [Deltaproteobacteria bacterium]|nr:YjbH domain-containing protein [Deltaproteobacteria bacterium]
MLKQRALALFFVWFLVAALIGTAVAADEPFDGPANWGGTGIMEIPTARVMRAGRYRFGASQVDPYRNYYFAVALLSGLEIGGRVTEVMGVGALTADYGNTRDKAIDFKYQFLAEGKWWPAIAVGIMDPHGTRVYPAQYLVASKQIYPFDFTIGFGNGRYGKQPLPGQGEGIAVEMFTDNASFRQDGQFFWGVQFALSERLMLMAEYNPIRYDEQTGDPAQAKYFTEPVPSQYNFGIRWRPLDWVETDLSWQRGQQIGANISVAFDMGVPLIPIYDHPYKEKPEYRLLHPWEQRIARGLDASGFSDIIVLRDGDKLAVEARNDKYYYTPRAVAVMLRVVTEFAPIEIRELRLIIANNGLPIVSLTCLREDAALFLAEKITAAEFLSSSFRRKPESSANNGYRIRSGMADVFNTDITDGLPGKKLYRKWWDYGILPSFRTFLNDPSGFFKYRFGARAWVGVYPWSGASLITGLEYYPFNTVSSLNTPSAEAVRTDIVPYQQNKAVLGILMAEQIRKFPYEIYGRLDVGLLEVQYGGLDAELATPLFGGRVMVGLAGSLVKKRDPDMAFGFKENDYKDVYQTAFLNTRINFPEIEAALDFKTGQFLAGDRGTVVTLSKFFNGVILSAWYSITNTDVFTDPFNRGYHDKGIAVTIPMRLFEGTDSKTAYDFAVSAWTRDVAQDIDHFNNLFDYMRRNTQIYLKKDALARDGRKAGFN